MNKRELRRPSNQGLKVGQFGFRWGPVNLARVGTYDNGAHVLYVNDVRLEVSADGLKVRVFDGNDVELVVPKPKPAAKKKAPAKKPATKKPEVAS